MSSVISDKADSISPPQEVYVFASGAASASFEIPWPAPTYGGIKAGQWVTVQFESASAAPGYFNFTRAAGVADNTAVSVGNSPAVNGVVRIPSDGEEMYDLFQMKLNADEGYFFNHITPSGDGIFRLYISSGPLRP